MNWIKRIFHVFLIVFACSATSYAQDFNRKEPYELMEQISDRLFERLKAENQEIKKDPEKLKIIVKEEVMPFIDYRYSALKVLGNHLKAEKNKENIKEFVEAFHLYLVTSYAQALTLYNNQTVQLEPKSAVPTNTGILGVKVDVLETSRASIKLEFKLRRNRKTGEWLIFDMVAEGVSLLSSKQSEWNTEIRKKGIPAVSQELIRLSTQPIRFKAETQ